MSVTRRADLALAFIALIWGTTFVLVKNALDDISTILFLALRFSIGAVAIATVFRNRLAAVRNWGAVAQAGAGAGTLLYAGYLLQTAGLRFTTPAKSAFVTGLYIVLVPLISAAVYKTAPRLFEIAGIALATAGMALMTLDPATLTMGYGDVLTLFCAAAFAGHIVVLSHYSGRVSYEGLTLVQLTISALIAGLTFFWIEVPKLAWTREVIAALVVTSLLATALAFALQTWAQQFTTATRAALIFCLEPVFAAVTSFLLGQETFTGRSIAGAGLILSGVLAVELKPSPKA